MTRVELSEGIGYEEHYDTGCPHRPSRPDVLEFSPEGVLRSDRWVDERGETHRLDGPSFVSYYEDGTVFEESYRVHGSLHREDGPAITRYREDGSKKEELFFEKGKAHRLDGPAKNHYLPSGEIDWAEYCREGKRSRIDGPAQWGSDGWKRYSLGGFSYDTHADLVRGAARRVESVTRADFEGTPLEPLVDELGMSTVLDVLEAGVCTPEGVREVLGGAPAEWVAAYEESRAP